MYIEFDIVDVIDDFDILMSRIQQWAHDHNVPYTTKVVKGLKLRLGLNYPEHFTLFFMTWNHCGYLVKNIDKS